MTSKFLCSMYNKTIIRFGFCDIQNSQGLGKGYQPQPSASADITPTSTLIILDITKTSSNNCLELVQNNLSKRKTKQHARTRKVQKVMYRQINLSKHE